MSPELCNLPRPGQQVCHRFWKKQLLLEPPGPTQTTRTWKECYPTSSPSDSGGNLKIRCETSNVSRVLGAVASFHSKQSLIARRENPLGLKPFQYPPGIKRDGKSSIPGALASEHDLDTLW